MCVHILYTVFQMKSLFCFVKGTTSKSREINRLFSFTHLLCVRTGASECNGIHGKWPTAAPTKLSQFSCHFYDTDITTLKTDDVHLQAGYTKSVDRPEDARQHTFTQASDWSLHKLRYERNITNENEDYQEHV